jgi:hypothetical protein
VKAKLRERRGLAAERHDSALARYPTREGTAFESELRTVVEELTEVAKAADSPSSDPVEVAKTYRWLGDAYFDLGRGRDEAALISGSKAYHRVEELLAGQEAPLEKAKLNFNYGNTLRGLSQGFHVGLLEAAQIRYENAKQVFNAHQLPDLAGMVTEQLRTIDPQLRLARKQAELQGGMDRMKELTERLKRADVVARDSIAHELEDIKKVRSRGDVGESLDEVLDAIKDQAEQYPERFGDTAGKIDGLESGIDALKGMLGNVSTEQTPSGTADGADQQIAKALFERLQKEKDKGTVSPDRAAQLGDIFGEFMKTMSEGGDDLESMSKRTQKMRDLIGQVMDPAASPSWSTPEPKSGSRAHWVVSILDPLKRYLMAEKGRGMLPSEESAAGTELLMRLTKLEARVREASDDDDRVAGLEGEVWRLAIAIQQHARRYHLIVAKPYFTMAKTHVEPKSVFVSGGKVLYQAAKSLEKSRGLKLFDRAGRGDYARERWNQLCSASVAVFDVGVSKGVERAEVCYELGLALVLGKPTVVANHGQSLPFNVELEPVALRGESKADAAELNKAIQRALGTIVWGGGEAGLGDGPRNALAWLDKRFGKRLSEGSMRISLRLVEENVDDAVAFRRSLGQLMGILGADAPALLLPAWPSAYPDPSRKPTCFHVMPFSKKWSNKTREIARKTCEKHGWQYYRGDEVDEQRIIRGIWDGIAGASAVLVDITDHNENVALELGLARALGRHCYIVAKGDPEKHMFASLKKVQVHGYGRAPNYSGFEKAVQSMLETANRD